MDRKKIMLALSQKKVQSPIFSIIFFLLFAFFVYFAIRPNLVTAFSLQKELQEVKLKNKEYEEQILQIVNYQTAVEQYRDDFPLLDEAVPQSPGVVKLVEDIRKSASESGIILSTLQVNDSFEYKNTEGKKLNKLMSFKLAITTDAQITQLQQFINALMNQRRIKTIESIEINSRETAEQGVIFSITMNLKGHYL
jgi:Tfp pilus assembly protein PilO